MRDPIEETLLARLIDNGVPAASLVFYGRWYQFESWLREIVYVELRAKYGSAWTAHLSGRAPKRVARDLKNNAYMASADAGDLLRYADFADLLGLIDANWPLFEQYLPPQERWRGRVDELRELRNRNAHCRRPHADDVGRLEQTLRDLEPGAQNFYASYARTTFMPAEAKDPLGKAWSRGHHETARRLLQHAEHKYGISFSLNFSVRPWARPPSNYRVTGREGCLWRADWILGAYEVRPSELWRRLEEGPSSTERLVHLLLEDTSVSATFSALEPSEVVADVIGDIFDAILVTSRRVRETTFEPDSVEQELARFQAEIGHLPARVQTGTALALVDPYRPDAFSIFAAG